MLFLLERMQLCCWKHTWFLGIIYIFDVITSVINIDRKHVYICWVLHTEYWWPPSIFQSNTLMTWASQMEQQPSWKTSNLLFGLFLQILIKCSSCKQLSDQGHKFLAYIKRISKWSFITSPGALYWRAFKNIWGATAEKKEMVWVFSAAERTAWIPLPVLQDRLVPKFIWEQKISCVQTILNFERRGRNWADQQRTIIWWIRQQWLQCWNCFSCPLFVN